MICHEEYGNYTLTVTSRHGILIGCISSSRDVPEPVDAMQRLHDGWGGTSLSTRPAIKRAYQVPEDHWAYRFCCNLQGDVNIINGEIGLDYSDHRRREWTVQAVFDHMKACLNA